MPTREPPKPAIILATPINVEESRAQRLQRQQSRFRDRGGIFVPSSRNTLADILLGKAAPLQKLRRSRSRSVSASPTKGKGHTGNDAVQEIILSARHATSRTSPRKKGRESVYGDATEISVKPIKKADATKAQDSQVDSSKTAAKSLKPRAVAKKSKKSPAAKVTGKSTKKKQAEPTPAENNDAQEDVAVPKSKGKGKAPKSSKSKTEKIPSENGDELEDVTVPKSKGKAQKPSTSRTSKATVDQPVKEVKTKSKPSAAPAKASKATSSTTVIELPKHMHSRPKSDLYSDGFSEDEYIPHDAAKNSKAKAKTKDAIPDKKEATASSKPSVKRTAPPNRNKTGPQLPDIPEEDEEDASDQDDSGPQPPAAKERPTSSMNKSSTKSNKRIAREADLDQEPSQPPKKRVKKSDNEVKSAVPEKSKPKAQKKDPKKRPLGEDADDEPNEKEPKPKRKKAVDPLESDAEQGAKMLTKTAKSRSQKSATANAKRSSSQTKKPAKRKQNASIPEQPKPPATVAIKRGPPKRVLQRIKDSHPDDLDNEPDPIDFLS